MSWVRVMREVGVLLAVGMPAVLSGRAGLYLVTVALTSTYCSVTWVRIDRAVRMLPRLLLATALVPWRAQPYGQEHVVEQDLVLLAQGGPATLRRAARLAQRLPLDPADRRVAVERLAAAHRRLTGRPLRRPGAWGPITRAALRRRAAPASAVCIVVVAVVMVVFSDATPGPVLGLFARLAAAVAAAGLAFVGMAAWRLGGRPL